MLICHMKHVTRKKMLQVAVLLETSHGVSRAMLQGIFNYVSVYGPWSLNVVEGGTSEQHLPDTKIWRGNGIIARIPNKAAAQAIIAARLPTVLFNPIDTYLTPKSPLAHYARIQCDSDAIGELAAEYFLGRTMRHCAFVGHPTEINWSRWRRDAFMRRLAQAQVKCQLYPLPPASKKTWSDERPLLCAWLKKLPKPAAIFAANDNRGRQILDACLISGIAVPYEVIVLGANNDTFICETSIPPLSSIAIDNEQAGYEAAQLLDRLMHRKEKLGRIVRYGPTQVITRASTADRQVTDKLVIRALEFIHVNAGLGLRVSDVATHLDVTPRWAEQIFKRAVGHSLHQEIHQVRMSTAHKMVEETDRPLTEIAARCGFQSANHLCKLFKAEFGCTMSTLRQSL